MRIDDREIHGGTPMAGCEKEPLMLFERDETISIKLGFHGFSLSSAAARHLARKLNRLALRIEKRRAPNQSNPNNGEQQ